MRVGQARKRDTNEAEIVDALEAIGVRVWRVSAPDLPDLLTYRRGCWLPIEVKSPAGRLTPGQWDTYRTAPFPIVQTVAEALAVFGVTDE